MNTVRLCNADVPNMNLTPQIQLATVLYVAVAANAGAQSLDVQEDLAGDLVLTSSAEIDTLSDLARAYDQGYLEMRLANPSIDPWLPGDGSEIIVPSRYILPDTPRQGIVVNVPEMRLYLFPPRRRDTTATVTTHPISIGRQEWTTPHGVTKIVAKVKNPNWYPPESIREEHAADGDPLPKVVPAGPDNPLGAFAIRLGLPGYLIHGTNKPYGIGMRVTHGCIRMYPKDVEQIFDDVKVGMPVRIVNQPYKIGIQHEKIYLEAHPHLDEDGELFPDPYSHVVELVIDKTTGRTVQLDWNALRATISARDGIPRAVGTAKLADQLVLAPRKGETRR